MENNTDKKLPVSPVDWDAKLLESTMTGNLDDFNTALENGAYVKCSHTNNGFVFYTPLHHAAENGCLTMVKVLVDKGADLWAPVWPENETDDLPGLSFFTALDLARDGKHAEVAAFLLDVMVYKRHDRAEQVTTQTNNRLSENMFCDTPTLSDVDYQLFDAILSGNMVAFNNALGKQAAVDCYYEVDDCNGFQPIHLAAACGHLEMVKSLVEHGASVKAIAWHSRGGCAALAIDWALQNGHTSVVDYLKVEMRRPRKLVGHDNNIGTVVRAKGAKEYAAH